MGTFATITSIHDFLDRWRRLGSLTLPNGLELIGRFPVDDEEVWMHHVFPGIGEADLQQLERELGTDLPKGLRGFYRRVGGLSLFLDAFLMHGMRRPGILVGSYGPQPASVVALNHELDVFGWRPKAAVAFATNSWDQTVHVAGMTKNPKQIVRCARATGEVIERHDDIFACIVDRLTRIDNLMLA